MANSAVWIAVGGAAALVIGGAVPDPQQRLVIRGAGGVALVVAFIMEIDSIMDFLGLAPPKHTVVTETVTTPIANVDKGSVGSKGILSGILTSPFPGAVLDKDQGTFHVEITLASSLSSSRTVLVEVQSKEFYSFGNESDGVMQTLGRFTVGPGQQKKLSAQVEYEAKGVTNPWYPPEVSLSLFLDGAPTDSLRFSYA